MKIVVNDEKYGTVEYEENFWTGRKQLTVGGVILERKNKKEYVSEEYHATITGTIFTGVFVNLNGTYIKISEKTSTTEYVLGFLPFILVLIWGNVPSLLAILPIVGGAIGGAIGGGVSAANLMFMKTQKNIGGKIIVSLIACAVAIMICYLVGILILSI